ncbi:protein-tyrosine phosphatase [Sphingomonas naasensis]|uniref:protein-tyrosine-phosphatase n=1 Tax=Sphingomonas naasensis TaxID=1344951 RepID=A0A4S1WTR7_9SPHN|nr:low molecular weight protein-tyrosine-phosphatase [Sphingomonas naasensis]NIJ18916.1 protein-tyrosine phosphatase [Sphingomonas naasensis]TGX46135.1 low molecular weight phosphotyrosine protein phosphatase [Sphingomonas naasensis]
MRPPSLLFVCLGNICRSPLAEAAFRAAAERAGLDAVAESAGTGAWHVGNPPDPRSVAVAHRHGIDISAKRARSIRGADFTGFDHILALDPQNLRDLHAMAPQRSTARIALLMDQVAGCAGQAVRDPYYGGEADFDAVWEQVTRAADALVTQLRA